MRSCCGWRRRARHAHAQADVGRAASVQEAAARIAPPARTAAALKFVQALQTRSEASLPVGSDVELVVVHLLGRSEIELQRRNRQLRSFAALTLHYFPGSHVEVLGLWVGRSPVECFAYFAPVHDDDRPSTEEECFLPRGAATEALRFLVTVQALLGAADGGGAARLSTSADVLDRCESMEARMHYRWTAPRSMIHLGPPGSGVPLMRGRMVELDTQDRELTCEDAKAFLTDIEQLVARHMRLPPPTQPQLARQTRGTCVRTVQG